MTEDAKVLFEVDGNVATVTINRPKSMNAVDEETQQMLDDVFNKIAANDDIRCVVVTGAGEKAFCAGADLKEDGPSGLDYWRNTNVNGFGSLAIRDPLAVPVIAKVNGIAVGGGFEMVLGCDLIVAADHAKFGFPEPRVGRLPLDGMHQLPRVLPKALVLGMLLTGRMIGAQTAQDWGIINQSVPADKLDETVRGWVDDILSCAPLSVKAVKATALGMIGAGLREARGELTPQLEAAQTSEDANEGVRAFREKRKPVWRGK